MNDCEGYDIKTCLGCTEYAGCKKVGCYSPDQRPQKPEAEGSAELNCYVCPFCGEEMRLFKTFRLKYALSHRCESGLKIEISSRKRKEILEILAKRAT